MDLPSHEVDVIDIQALFQELDAPDLNVVSYLHQLPKTWENSIEVAEALLDWHRQVVGLPLKSSWGQHYDLFHDIVLRHRRPLTPAYRHLDREFQSLSWWELTADSDVLMAEWHRRGTIAGTHAVLLLPMGPPFLVALITCLRMGVVATLLPPGPPELTQMRIKAATPTFVATERAWVGLVPPGVATRIIGAKSNSSSWEGSGSYVWKPDGVVLRCFSPVHQDPFSPTEITAHDLFAALLRDCLFSLRIFPGDEVAAPGFPLLQHQPTLLLATWLGGGIFVHAEVNPLVQHPEWLERLHLRTLGVSRELRDRWLEHPPDPPLQIDHWFRDPSDVLDWDVWRNFIAIMGLQQVPASNILMDAGSGGTLLLSVRRPGIVHQLVVPPPGLRWTLKRLDQSGGKAYADYGIFEPDIAGAELLGNIVLARQGAEWFYGDRLRPAARGRPWPEGPVAARVAALPWVDGAMGLVAAGGGEAGRYRRILLVFCHAAHPLAGGRDHDKDIEEVRQVVVSHFGEDLAPDVVEMIPFHPPGSEGRLDPARVEAGFLTGTFQRKLNEPIFHTVSGIRQFILAQGR